MTTFMLSTALKAQQWERTKGELRAMVALQGSHRGDSTETQKWTDLEHEVNDFIEKIEYEGLHE